MALSKSQKRKFKRYGKIPSLLRDMWERDGVEFSYIFNDEVQDAKKRIYRKPYYRFRDHFDTLYRRPLKTEIIEI